LRKKELDLQAAQLNLKQQALNGNNQMDELKANIAKLQLEMDDARKKIREYIEKQAPPDPVTAPIDGEIVSFDVVAGTEVTGNMQIAEIVNYGKLVVHVQVDELDVVKIKTGTPAEVTVDALPGKIFEGEVAEIAREFPGNF